MTRYIALRETGSETVLLIDKLLKTVEEIDVPVDRVHLGRYDGVSAAVVLPTELLRQSARFHYDDDNDDPL